MVVSDNVGVFVWSLVGEVSAAVDEFAGRVLHRGNGVAVAVVGEIFDGLGCKWKREKKNEGDVGGMDSVWVLHGFCSFVNCG